MNENTNIEVSFSSDDFNKSAPKDYFVNPNCFGDDLAVWLMIALKTRDLDLEDDGPDQEDFGWYFNFEYQGKSYSCVVLYREDVDRWTCILEYNVGFIGSLFGRRKKPVPVSVAKLLDQILGSEPDKFQNIEWSNFESPNY